MARFYYLLIAFDNQNAAEKCASFFSGKTFSLASGRTFQSPAHVSPSDNENLFWVTSEPEGVSIKSQSKPRVQDAAQLDEIAMLLYQALTCVEHYSCAIVGWEVADLFLPNATCGYSEMRIDPLEFNAAGWDGLVIAETLWAIIEKNGEFLPFHKGYIWKPYQTLSISGW